MNDYRRRGDPSPDDSFVKRVSKRREFDTTVKTLLAVATALATTYGAHRVTDANEAAKVEGNRAEILKLQSDLADSRKKMYERVGKEESEREQFQRDLERRIAYIEGRLDALSRH